MEYDFLIIIGIVLFAIVFLFGFFFKDFIHSTTESTLCSALKELENDDERQSFLSHLDGIIWPIMENDVAKFFTSSPNSFINIDNQGNIFTGIY